MVHTSMAIRMPFSFAIDPILHQRTLAPDFASSLKNRGPVLAPSAYKSLPTKLFPSILLRRITMQRAKYINQNVLEMQLEAGESYMS